MTVEIPPEFQRFVESVLQSGAFRTEAEVVGEALRLFQERQRRLDELRKEIQPALDRLDRGEGLQLDDEGLDVLFEDIKRRGRERCQARETRR